MKFYEQGWKDNLQKREARQQEEEKSDPFVDTIVVSIALTLYVLVIIFTAYNL